LLWLLNYTILASYQNIHCYNNNEKANICLTDKKLRQCFTCEKDS